MPCYVYFCKSCRKEFDAIVPVARRDELQPCPAVVDIYSLKQPAPCEQPSARKGVELNASHFPGAASWRKS